MGRKIYAGGVPGMAQVLTENDGWKPIMRIRDDERVWDGNEWVSHEGVVYIGDMIMIEFQGVIGTYGLFVYTPTRYIPVMLGPASRGLVKFLRCDTQPDLEKYPIPKTKRKDNKRAAFSIVNAGTAHRFACQGVIVHNLTLEKGEGRGGGVWGTDMLRLGRDEMPRPEGALPW